MSSRLVHVSDDMPGICRQRRGRGFSFIEPDGHRVSDARQLRRIRALAIPPAYRSVWICPSPLGHLQATGRDARGRKQYLYHAEWRQARDETKFDRMADFGAALARIRSRVSRDLGAWARGADVLHDTVVAVIVRLLDTTLVRVGNDEYARDNASFGLTTLRKRHVDLKGRNLRLHFRGKSGVMHEVAVHDLRLARIVRHCQTLPGQELFQYRNEEGDIHGISSTDVNDYLRAASGGEFTAKDFRTWHGSVQALQLWRESSAGEKESDTAANANQLIAEVARRLGNTPAVCRKSYIHPRILTLLAGPARSKPRPTKTPARKRGLSLGECEFLAFLGTAS